MNDPTMAQWVTPIACAVFAIVFLGLGFLRAELRNARLFGIAYILAMIASSCELLIPQADVWTPARVVGDEFYVVCSTMMAAAAAAEWRGRVDWRLVLGGGTLAALTTFSVWYFPVSIGTRVTVNALVNGAMLTLTAAFIWPKAHSIAARALAVFCVLVGTSVSANGVILGIQGGLTVEAYASSSFVAVLTSIIALGAILIALALMGHFALRLQSTMQTLADTDGMTGLLNRRAFENAAETQREIVLLVTDIDRFKRINDRHGHQAGDAVITGFARLLAVSAPEDALVGRLGGEEFCVLLPRGDSRVARLFAEGLRTRLGSQTFDAACGEIAVTASFGIAAGHEYHETFARADAALYRAKEAGRDRVECDDDPVARLLPTQAAAA